MTYDASAAEAVTKQRSFIEDQTRLQDYVAVQEYRPQVLVVEDDLDMVEIIEKILLSVNPAVEVSWTSSAEEAYFRLYNHKVQDWESPYDLIIADVFLDGDETGLDLYRKCLGVYPEIPFIATSSTSIEKFYTRFGFSKIPVFLSKPVKFYEWKTVLSELL